MRSGKKQKNWIGLITKAFALLVIVVGTLLFWKTNYYDPYAWGRHRDAGMAEFKTANYPGAEIHFLAALNEAEKFAPRDPRLHLTLNSLVEIYLAQSKYSEAEFIIKRVLAIDEQLLGPDHPNVGASLNNLAENYRNQNKYKEAETSYKQALAIFEKLLGSDDPLVAHIRERYIDLLRKIGKVQETETHEVRGNGIKKDPIQATHQ